MNEKTKNVLSAVLRFGLSAILLIWLYFKIDVEKTLALVKTADVKYIFYAFIILVVIHGLLLIRWLIYIHAMDLPAPVLNVLRFFLIGLFGNLFLPTAIGGDVIKTIGLCTSSSQKPKVVGSVLLDRLSGFAGMVIIATLAFILGYRLINDFSLSIFIILMAITSSSIGVVLFNERIYTFCCKIFSAFPKLKEGLMNMHYDIALLKEKREVMYLTVGISGVCQILLSFCFFFIARALHQQIPFIPFLVFVPLICVAASFPSIGGLGVREAGTAYLFGKIGVESGVAVSMSLMIFLFMVALGLMGWLYFVLTKTEKVNSGLLPKKE